MKNGFESSPNNHSEDGDSADPNPEARARLQSELNKYSLILKSLFAPVIVCDHMGRIIEWNLAAERMFGFARQEAVGRTFETLYTSGEGGPLTQRIHERNVEEGAWTGEMDIPIKAGGKLPSIVSIVSIRVGQNQYPTIIEVHRQPAEPKTTESQVLALHKNLGERSIQLATARKEMEDFSYSVSHDLRAPLRAIDGFTKILMQDFAEHLPDGAKRYLGIIRDNTQQMGKLIDDLLILARLSRQTLVRIKVDPNILLRNTLEKFADVIRDRNIEFVYSHLPKCHGDASLLSHVFVNLIDNAIKFTRPRENPRIEIGCDTAREMVRTYYIKDNGVGFDMRYRNKLFGVFQRLHPPDEFEGTGVGLAIAHRIIKRHGGEISAESIPDVGTTVTFSLDAVWEDPKATS